MRCSLIEKLTNGCRIEINETGTSLYYKPGVLAFGHPGDLVHDCGTSRSGVCAVALCVLSLRCRFP